MRRTRITSYKADMFQTVPFIRISGKWLERLGFNIGSTFHLLIDKHNKRIILQLTRSNTNEQ
jgi:hypothetical protein